MRLIRPIFFFLFASASLHAQQPADPATARLRESLKNTMLQLRTAQTEQATLQASQATLEAEKKTLSDQVAALTKQAIADKDASTKEISDLQAKATERDAEIAALKTSLEKWKIAYEKATAIGQTTETDRAKLAARVIVLDRQVADQKLKNAQMYQLGKEILARYEKFGLGDALTAREPFVGLTRVKFENLIQDYSDKIADQKIRP